MEDKNRVNQSIELRQVFIEYLLHARLGAWDIKIKWQALKGLGLA